MTTIEKLKEEKLKKRINNILFSIIIIALLLFLVWGIHMAKLQLDYDKKCKSFCLNDSSYTDYEVSYFSYPLNNVNGKCICMKIVSDIIKEEDLK